MNRPARACALTLALVGVYGARAQRASAQSGTPPSLVAMIVVDQLGGGLLDRYDTLFHAGFRRLLDEGYRFTQASNAHAMTETAPGHATLATGVFPARHGIVSNTWHQRTGFAWPTMYAVGDDSVRIVGFEDQVSLPGRSPRNLMRDGLADWVIAQDRDARVVSISKKDRAAVAMGGHTRGNVWWMLDNLGLFITSTYYIQSYPDWIRRFNRDVMPGFTQSLVWESLVPPEARSLAADDRARYEGDREHTTFPHLAREEVPSGDAQATNIWAFLQPRADDAVLALTKRTMEELGLGQRPGHIEFLALSFSALDEVGHQYGPLSQEAFSTLLNLDLVLGELFRYFDETVGEGRWVVGLAGDHGAPTISERARQMGNREAERIDESDLFEDMSDALTEAASTGARPERISELVARSLVEDGVVEAAYTHHQLTLGGEPADSFAVLYRNSHYPGRAWGIISQFGVEVRYGEGDLVTSFRTGTSHGSPYWYDRHVEMIWLGAGVQPGTSDRPVYSIDFAPTLAALGHIQAPEDLDGRRLF